MTRRFKLNRHKIFNFRNIIATLAILIGVGVPIYRLMAQYTTVSARSYYYTNGGVSFYPEVPAPTISFNNSAGVDQAAGTAFIGEALNMKTNNPSSNSVAYYSFIVEPDYGPVPRNEYWNTARGNINDATSPPGGACNYYNVGNSKIVTGLGCSSRGGTVTVPDDDAVIGKKLCVAAIASETNYFYRWVPGYTDSEGKWHPGYWSLYATKSRYATSKVSCFTIAKKPNFQAWNGSVYSGASIATSISKKIPAAQFWPKNYNAITDMPVPSNRGDVEERIFGSWSQYAVYARNSIIGMASDSGYGYSELFQTWANFDRDSILKITGYDIRNWSPTRIGNAIDVLWNTKLETAYNPVDAGARANQASNTQRLNFTGITADQSTAANRLRSRYTNRDADLDQGKGSFQRHDGEQVDKCRGIMGGNAKCGMLPDGTFYIHFTGNAQTTRPIELVYADDVLDLYNRVNSGTEYNNTMVIQVDGTFTIRHNICIRLDAPLYNETYHNAWSDYARTIPASKHYEWGTRLYDYKDKCGEYDQDYFTESNKNSFDWTRGIASTPQILIFANTINFAPNTFETPLNPEYWQMADRVDAWMIASGNINTCFIDSSLGGETARKNSPSLCNHQLMINGPVYAGSVNLQRTFGANGGFGTAEARNQFCYYDGNRASDPNSKWQLYSPSDNRYFYVGVGQSEFGIWDPNGFRIAVGAVKSANNARNDDYVARSAKPYNRDCTSVYDSNYYQYYGNVAHSTGSFYDNITAPVLTNDGSITPAEIFNLNKNAYYWAFSEANDYTQAVTTSIIELTPKD